LRYTSLVNVALSIKLFIVENVKIKEFQTQWQGEVYDIAVSLTIYDIVISRVSIREIYIYNKNTLFNFI